MESKNDIFIRKSREIHSDKYEYSKVQYKNAATKVIITCLNHGEFYQLPQNHIKGQGCKTCSNVNKTITTEQFISKSEKIHNKYYNYSKTIYTDSRIKVVIICLNHGEFYQLPNSHLVGKGCKKCKLTSKETFINKSIKIHHNKFDYSKINFINMNTKVIIVCPVHGDFEQLPTTHMQGSNCLQCSIQNRIKSKENFIEQSDIIHNKQYNYSNIDFINMNTKITIICKNQHTFEQLPSEHQRGQGCPLCRFKTESILNDFLLTQFQNFTITKQKTFDWLFYKGKQRLDFYIEELNIAIECQETQHFKNIKFFGNNLDKVQQLDYNKRDLLKQHKIPIIYIYQDDIWKNKYDWQLKLKQAINFIIDNKNDSYLQIEIGSIYSQ